MITLKIKVYKFNQLRKSIQKKVKLNMMMFYMSKESFERTVNNKKIPPFSKTNFYVEWYYFRNGEVFHVDDYLSKSEMKKQNIFSEK